ncbi:MAG: two-component sensor histidine kinase [Oscillatoriales cyanobacterium C42_A2020_001]|nr:two-component sensor histidine kinase [Leptolyngbyaceae cyanobacterium C42_A2020_001]
MHQNKLFNRTRLQLAGCYAAVMGVILSLSGLTIHQLLAIAHWQAVEQELESISGTLHDTLEPKLIQPDRLEPGIEQALPGLCVAQTDCSNSNQDRHILGIVQQGNYYLRFFTQSGELLAGLGSQPEGLPSPEPQAGWQTLQGQSSTRYHQITLLLKTATGSPWGYMQLGRSLKEYDDHLATVRLLLAIGLPLSMLAVAGASWWLAGLAMHPVYQSYRQMQQFTADAAHELRTPIAAIRANVESVQGVDDPSNEEMRDTLAAVNRQNKRLAHLVQDLLLLSRMDQQVVTEKQPCCLNDLIQDLVESLSVLEMAASIKLLTQLPVKEPVWVIGDENQLIRLCSNLIVNALQYTPSGGSVTVILERDETQALIQVQDTGIGIAPADQSRIFDRFYRVNRDRSRHTGGAGLGLAIAKAIAQFHHGSIQVKSELGNGSTFTVRLPLAIPCHDWQRQNVSRRRVVHDCDR